LALATNTITYIGYVLSGTVCYSQIKSRSSSKPNCHMTQKDLLDSIKKHLGRFQAQIKISNANSEYDINIHTENVLIPILNLIFSCDLTNVNYAVGKNAEAIDLLDERKRIAFQVTSTARAEKIRNTLQKFLSSKFISKVDHLYVIIISDRTLSFAQRSISKIIGKKIKFEVKKNILNLSDLYRLINEQNNIGVISKVEELLCYQFSDIFINKTFTLSKLEDFKGKYKESCIANFSRINFFGLSVGSNKPREIELYSLFVKPTFTKRLSGYIYKFDSGARIDSNFKMAMSDLLRRENNVKIIDPDKIVNYNIEHFLPKTLFELENNEYISSDYFQIFHSHLSRTSEIKFDNLFSNEKDIVIIGKPGAGKSSFIKYSICKILERDESVFENKRIYDCIPFRIELHKYNKFKKAKNSGILKYLSELLNEEYQINLTYEEVEATIRSFPSLFFFDGLDEIFDIHERTSVRNDIESFVKTQINVRSIVTSRVESYEEVSLSSKVFSQYEILDFNENQVIDYVRKWYSIEELNNLVRDREIKSCIIQLKSVDDELKYNPLLLSLILLLYRSELDIPTSKLSIYESCTNTIVETRDTKEKKLGINIKIGNIISVFAALGYWQFETERKGEVINHEVVKKYIKKYLFDKGEFQNDHDAEIAAIEFLEFAKVRSIYFENKFTHKTFLEYFAAYYIFSYYYGNYKKAAELSEIFSKYIGYSSWSVVLELLVCKIDSTQINYEVIDDMLDKQLESNFLDTLIFFLQILRYLKNISPAKVKLIISNSIEYCFKDGESTREGKLDYKEILFSHLVSFSNSDKNKQIIENEFRNFTQKRCVDIEFLCAFAYEFAIVSGNTALIEILKMEEIESDSEYIFLLKYYPSLFDNSKYIDTVKIFIERYSIQKLLVVYRSLFNQKIFFGSVQFNWLISFLLQNVNIGKMESLYLELINKVNIPGEIFLKAAEIKISELRIINDELLSQLKTANDNDFKKFTKRLVETHMPRHPEIKKTKELYGTLFRKSKKK
jgi:hypothetical protein